MKKLIPAIALALAACAAPAMAADVGVSISIGEPGFYGELNIGDFGRPRLVNARPVVVERRYRNLAPVYLRVPPGHQRNWHKYCARYDACYRPVYFVRDDWYTKVYAPRYRELHSHGPGRPDFRRDDRGRDRHDDHDRHDRGRDHRR